ncbi:MAG: hypothetical protein JWO62_2631 [Acidimicrobiaceae bacterium]|nr:hypothetical protein [Acidimicrobiaceae bacterium]
MSLKTDEAALSELIEVQRAVRSEDLSAAESAELDGIADRARFDFTQRAQAHFQEYILLGESVRFFLDTNDAQPMREALAAIEAQD